MEFRLLLVQAGDFPGLGAGEFALCVGLQGVRHPGHCVAGAVAGWVKFYEFGDGAGQYVALSLMFFGVAVP